MYQRRPPLGAMLLGLTGLLAGWSMAALAGTGADRDPARGDAAPRDVPMVVAPPGGSGTQDTPPSPLATRPRPTTEAPRRTTRTTTPSPRTPTTTAAPTPQAKPAAGPATAPTAPPPAAPPAPPGPAAPVPRPSPPATAPPAPTVPAPPAPPATVPAPPSGGAPEPPQAGPRCDVPRNQPPWAEQAELLDIVEATQGVVDEVGAAGFAGFVVTPEKCRLDLYWVGAPPPEVAEVVRRDRRVVIHDDAAHDHAALARAAEALWPGSPLGRSAGVEITSVAIPPEGSGLRVGVERRRRLDVRATAARLSAAAGVPVDLVVEGPSRPFGRVDDRAPWSAGGRAMIRVNDGGSERWTACSVGYGLRAPRTMREYTVTAAHCFDEAVDATAWNGSRRAAIGDWGAMSLALDVAYVATDESAGRPGTSAYAWSGGVDARDDEVRTVIDAAPTVKGMWVCGSGAATGENCGIKVTDVDVVQRATLPNSGAAYTVRHTARGYRVGGASGSGDSGGPVFAPGGPGRSDAHAVGVIHGGVDGAAASCLSEPNPTECSESVIFVPIAEVQRWIGGELRVAHGWTAADRPGPDR
jgi:hypothetical protein